VLVEHLAADIRRLRDDNTIEQCLKPMLAHFGDAEGLGSFWIERFKELHAREPRDKSAEYFIHNTLLGILAMDEACQRRNERMLKSFRQLELALRKIKK